MKKLLPWMLLVIFGGMVVCFCLAAKSMFDQLGGSSEVAGERPAGWNTRPVAKPGEGAAWKLSFEDKAAVAAGAVEGQRVLFFKDDESMRRFLGNLGEGVQVMGVIPALRAVRVEFDDLASMADGLSKDEESMMVFPLAIPSLADGTVQPDALAVGSRLLKLLGVDEASVNWGAGVKVAILDTGVVPSDGLGRIVQMIDLVPSTTDVSGRNGHGTAVASVVVGQDPRAPGVAPAAEIIAVRVANDDGWSDSFLLAQGIVEAVEAGARLINISMAGFGDSQVLRDAVDYASKRGSLVIASVGNHGVDQVPYPAAIPGVIGVGAVDATGRHLLFSNTGREVDVSAPGWGMAAAWTDGSAVSVSGTSFSAPVVTGALAAIMSGGSNQTLDARSAWDLMSRYLNDAGAEGVDPQYGAGMPDLGRIIQRDVPGIHDAAVASLNWIEADARYPYGQLEVLVQNRGTERLINTAMTVQSGELQHRVNLNLLEPGAVQTVRVPISKEIRALGDSYQASSTVLLGGEVLDSRPGNNRMTRTFMVVESP